MKRRVSAVLFDLDDVVVRTESYHNRAWKRLADEEGWQFTEETAMLLRGLPRMQCLELILKENSLNVPDSEKTALASRKNAYLVELLCGLGPDDLLPGVIDFMEGLKKCGAKLGVFSLSQNAGVVLESLSLREHFDAVLTGQDDRCTYYNPDIFHQCAKMLDVKPEECVVFENIDSAAQFALGAKMHVIGVGVPDLMQTVSEVVRDFSRADPRMLLEEGCVTHAS